MNEEKIKMLFITAFYYLRYVITKQTAQYQLGAPIIKMNSPETMDQKLDMSNP